MFRKWRKSVADDDDGGGGGGGGTEEDDLAGGLCGKLARWGDDGMVNVSESSPAMVSLGGRTARARKLKAYTVEV